MGVYHQSIEKQIEDLIDTEKNPKNAQFMRTQLYKVREGIIEPHRATTVLQELCWLVQDCRNLAGEPLSPEHAEQKARHKSYVRMSLYILLLIAVITLLTGK